LYLQGEILRIKRPAGVHMTEFSPFKTGHEITYEIDKQGQHRLINLDTGEVIDRNSSFIDEINQLFVLKVEAKAERGEPG
jgi:hypothetical protein